MNSNKRTTRLGVLVAGSAAMLAFGMTAPAMAMPATGGGANTVVPGSVYNPADGTSKGPADVKNPPGQIGNTHSNGYECNGNAGVGSGNSPAHTNNCDGSGSDDANNSSVVIDTNVS